MYLRKLLIKNYIHKNLDYSFILFTLGLFFLPSAFVISGTLIIISTLINSFKIKNYLNDDPWNNYFLIGGLLMLISAIVQTFNLLDLLKNNYDVSLTWIGLANWIPFFWCYWGFKSFLNSANKRKISAIALVTGSIPVIASGIGQVFFNWNGPFKTFYDLIIWYQRPLENVSGLTGLFNNPNYAGSWLNVIWPFVLGYLIYNKESIFEKISIYIFAFSISFSIILTNSRSAWIGIFIGTIMVYGEKSFKFIRNLLFLISIFIAFTIYPFFGENLQNIVRKIIPESIWTEFTDFQYSRIEIWQKGIETVIKNPIFGSGASSFSKIFQIENGIWKGHAHNLPLEFFVSYGIPAGIAIFIPIFLITYHSIKKVIKLKGNKESTIIDQAWVSALFVLLLSQMVDVQYFDGRISIVLWVLLCGAKKIIEEKNVNSTLNNNDFAIKNDLEDKVI